MASLKVVCLIEWSSRQGEVPKCLGDILYHIIWHLVTDFNYQRRRRTLEGERGGKKKEEEGKGRRRRTLNNKNKHKPRSLCASLSLLFLKDISER
jgi:hypothetical protein